MKSTRTIALSVCAFLTVAALSGCSSDSDGAQAGPSEDCTPAHPDAKTLKEGELNVLVYVTPPYTVQDGDTFGGVDGTIVAELAEMECLKLVAKPVSAAAGLASIQGNRADIAIGGIYYTEERTETLSLSAGMYRDGMALLSAEELDGSLAGLEGKSVGVIQGYLWNEDLQAALGSDNVKTYQDSAGMITDLKSGRLDAAVLTSAEAGYRAKEDDGLVVTAFEATPEVAASEQQNDVVLAMPLEAAELTAALNEDIEKLVSDGTVATALEDNGMDPSLAGSASTP